MRVHLTMLVDTRPLAGNPKLGQIVVASAGLYSERPTEMTLHAYVKPFLIVDAVAPELEDAMEAIIREVVKGPDSPYGWARAFLSGDAALLAELMEREPGRPTYRLPKPVL